MKYDLFVSYSRRDFDEVQDFLKVLKNCIPSIEYWFDVDGIESGDEFEEKIISAIDGSSYVLFAISDNSLNSTWTKDEVMYARNTGKKVIPILLKGAKLYGWFLFKFGRIDCIDITNDIQISKLMKNLSAWIKKELVPVSTEVGYVNYLDGNINKSAREQILSTSSSKSETVRLRRMSEVKENKDVSPRFSGIYNGIDYDKLDPLFVDVARSVVLAQNASITLIQRSFGVGHDRAQRIMEQLCNVGIVGDNVDGNSRKVLYADVAELESRLSMQFEDSENRIDDSGMEMKDIRSMFDDIFNNGKK